MESSNLTDTSTESSNLTDTSTESRNLTDTSTESSNYNLTDPSTESSNLADTSTESRNTTDTYMNPRFMESDTIVDVIVLTLGVMAFGCVFLFTTTCICYRVIIQRKKLFKRKDQESKHAITGLQHPEPQEIPVDVWRSRTTFGLLHALKGAMTQ